MSEDRSAAPGEPLAPYQRLASLPDVAALRAHLDALLGQDEPAAFALLQIRLAGLAELLASEDPALGDRLLREAAHRTRGWVGEHDYVARHARDEFAVVVHATDPRKMAQSVSRRLLEVLGHPIDFGRRDVLLRVSIGIALFPDSAAEAGTLLARATAAMDAATARGGACALLDPGLPAT